MKTPRFWQSNNLLSSALLPLAVLYDAGRRLRNAITAPALCAVPVICVGNLTAGGAGKTPVALYIGKKLQERGINACFLSRGYGGSLKGPVLVDTHKHAAREVGDEPLLLAKVLPTIVAKSRPAGAGYAAEHGAQLIIMDDGLQNPTLEKTLSLVVIDGTYGFGNGRLLPAGPLREPAGEGLKKAHAIIVINPAPDAPLPAGATVVHARTYITNPEAFVGKKLLAFCGIAMPEKFFSLLRTLHTEITETVAFADHHAYTDTDVESLMAKAKAAQAILVTTAKDAVRLPPALRDQIAVAGMELAFDNDAALMKLIDRIPAHGKN